MRDAEQKKEGRIIRNYTKKEVFMLLLYAAGLVIAVVLLLDVMADKKEKREALDVNTMSSMPNDATSAVSSFTSAVEQMPESREKSEFLSYAIQAKEDGNITADEYQKIKIMHHSLQTKTN